uniref:Strictosidine synthase n=1 Tax=Vinca minor TaxID=60093 RepID=H6UH13_VINMI|nr:strictosidine synthase [Vinca minor]
MALFTALLLLLSSSLVLSSPILKVILIDTPSYAPNSFTFDSTNKGFYTAVQDGRILKYQGPNSGFIDFAYASPYWNRGLCEKTRDEEKKPICGRTYDIAYYYKKKEIYIVDSYYHLSVVGAEGGYSTQLSTSVDGVPFKWLYAVTVDQTTGLVYFTDVSSIYHDSPEGIEAIMGTSDRTGRLMRYDPSTKETTLLMKELHVPGGAEISADSSFIVVAEFLSNRIVKYWLQGPKKGTTEFLVKIPNPGNIKRNKDGHFWVSSSEEEGGQHGKVTARGIKFDEFGNILQVILLPPPYVGEHFEQIQERDGLLYIGTLFHGSVGILQYYPEKGIPSVSSQ